MYVKAALAHPRSVLVFRDVAVVLGFLAEAVEQVRVYKLTHAAAEAQSLQKPMRIQYRAAHQIQIA